jgi:acyl-CoA thioesterase FadM
VARIDYPTLVRRYHLGFPAVRVESDFRAPFRYGETAEIAVAVERLGGSSATWTYVLSAAGEAEPRARARVVTVCLDMAAYEKRPIPDWLRHRLLGEASELPPAASTG